MAFGLIPDRPLQNGIYGVPYTFTRHGDPETVSATLEAQ